MTRKGAGNKSEKNKTSRRRELDVADVAHSRGLLSFRLKKNLQKKKLSGIVSPPERKRNCVRGEKNPDEQYEKIRSAEKDYKKTFGQTRRQ